MFSGQFEPARQQYVLTLERPQLVRQYPVLIPVLLVLGAVGLCIVSFFADTLFPVLALIGVPSVLVCLSVALVLGVAGVLAAIISIIEGIDRYRLRNSCQTTAFPKPKGA